MSYRTFSLVIAGLKDRVPSDKLLPFRLTPLIEILHNREKYKKHILDVIDYIKVKPMPTEEDFRSISSLRDCYDWLSNLRIIALCGRSRVGKSTCAELLSKIGYKKYAIASAMKDSLGIAVGVRLDDSIKSNMSLLTGETYARMMQIYAQGIRSIFGSNFWINRLLLDLEDCRSSLIVIEDVRFEVEADTLKLMGAHLIRITRPVTDINGRDPVLDSTPDQIQYDTEIANTGTIDDLRNAIVKIACEKF